MQLHMLYTKSLEALSEEEREAAKKECLDRVGVPKDI